MCNGFIMPYDENQLKEALELLNEIEFFRTKKLNQVRSILYELNGNNYVYSINSETSICFDKSFTTDTLKTIIADMEANNKSKENTKTNARFREDSQIINKYGPNNEYPPKNLK